MSNPRLSVIPAGAVTDPRLEARDLKPLADTAGLGALLRMAHPTVDHYMPALTIAGASDGRDQLTFMTDAIDLGSVSMRSFVFHA